MWSSHRRGDARTKDGQLLLSKWPGRSRLATAVALAPKSSNARAIYAAWQTRAGGRGPAMAGNGGLCEAFSKSVVSDESGPQDYCEVKPTEASAIS